MMGFGRFEQVDAGYSTGPEPEPEPEPESESEPEPEQYIDQFTNDLHDLGPCVCCLVLALVLVVVLVLVLFFGTHSPSYWNTH